MTRRRKFLLIAVTSVLCAVGLDARCRASDLTISELVSNKDSFDDREVVLKGTAAEIQSRDSLRGNLFTTLTLREQEHSVTVLSFGKPDIRVGDQVEVRGVFRRIHHPGRETSRDEVEAWSVSRLD